jgi:DNA-binding transcriptional LysR family regulator
MSTSPNRDWSLTVADNSATLRAFALTGQGVAILPQWLIQDDLEAGRLVRLLPDYRFAQQGFMRLPGHPAFAAEGAGVH